MESFKNKNYLIFAGTSSIGSDLIGKLTSNGANVFFTSRNKEKAEKIANKYDCDYEICEDIANFEKVDEIFKLAIEKNGEIYGTANFSGSIVIKPAQQIKYDEFIEVINKNLTSSFAITRAAEKYMTSGGSVLFISSIAASVGIANHEAIASAKAGIEGLIRSAACSYAGKNLRFNAIAPSLTDTNLSKMLTSSEMMLKISNSMHALGRIGSIGDVSRVCEFFMDPLNDWITGEVFNMGGGFALKAKPKV